MCHKSARSLTGLESLTALATGSLFVSVRVSKDPFRRYPFIATLKTTQNRAKDKRFLDSGTEMQILSLSSESFAKERVTNPTNGIGQAFSRSHI